ncbi:MAG: DUF285 domain-containing protein [Succinivibrio sp.]|nr:DUF285 domain-containing protein [Succinivibrio sp.]
MRRLNELQELFQFIQEAFFVKPVSEGCYQAAKLDDRLMVSWKITSTASSDKLSAKVRKQVESGRQDGEVMTLGEARVYFEEQGDRLVLHTEQTTVQLEPAFDRFKKADSEVISILAQRCLDYPVIKKELADFLGRELSELGFVFIPKDILSLRVLINNPSTRLGEIEVGELTDLSYAFSLYADNQVQENPRKDFSGVEHWNTSKVRNMLGVFAGCVNFNQDISGWDVSAAEKMDVMFASCKHFNQDLSGWHVENCTSMKGMFYKCESFSQNLSAWQTSKVTDMSMMFCGCRNLTCDLHEWSVDKLQHDESMFQDCNLADELKPALPSNDFKREYYNKYVGPDSKRYQREEIFKKIGLLIAFIIVVFCFSIFNQQ